MHKFSMRGLILATLAARGMLFVEAAHSQEIGNLQTFGSTGRLYSAGDDEFYLLSRQPYQSEDSRGYEGQVRIVKNYAGGGYEERTMDYTARCFAPFDNMVYVSVTEPGKEEYKSVDIKTPDHFQRTAKKSAYNLYWAVCRDTFMKFR